MAAWKVTFDKGVACFQRGHLDEALAHMNQAAELQSSAFIIYDSRAAVHEKLGNLKAALLDSKRVIDLAPDRWHGYARSARLFDLVGKYGSAVKMADHALSRLRPEDVQRRAQLVELREKAVAAQRLSQATQTSYLLGKLPVETLVEIFTMLIDEDHTWAVRLSHVCGHWRRILIHTPSAWQTLVLSKRHPLQKVKLWKQRAQNRITHITVSLPLLDRALVFPELRDLSWNDLSSLRISGEAIVELHHILSDISLSHTFSKLDELILLNYTSPEQLSCCLSGPNWNLRILHLYGFLHLPGFPGIMDEWWQRIQQLRELHLTFVRRVSMRVFTANPLLERLVLVGPLLEPAESDAALTSVDNLKSIECREFRNPFRFLRAITAPSITHFSMHGAAINAHEALLHIASRPSLVELHIIHCSLGRSTLPTLLTSTPNLETLQVTAINAVANDMFEFLTPQTGGSLPCRALKHIDVSWCSDLTTSSIYAFVKTRVQHASESVESAEKCAVIESLRVDACPNIEPDMLPWFRSKVAQFSCVYNPTKNHGKDRRQ